MSNTATVLLSVLLVVGGLALALLLPDLELLWFRGRPLGVVLAVVGVWELVAAAGRASGDRT